MEELLDLKAQHPDAKLVVGNTEIGKTTWRPLGTAGLFPSLLSLPELPPAHYSFLYWVFRYSGNTLRSSVHMGSQDIGLEVSEAWFNPCLSILREVPGLPLLCME